MDIDNKRLGNLPHHLRANSSPPSGKFSTIKRLVQAVLSSCKDVGFFDTKFICFPRRGGDDVSRCAAKASRAAKLLHQQVPNVRFIITWTSRSANSDENVAGEIEVVPSIPYDIGKFVITRPAARRFQEINGFCVLLSLPFLARLEMLWNEWGSEKPEKGASASAPILGLADIVEYEIVIELERFITNPPWPDCIRKLDLLSHLKRLETFFNYNNNQSFSHTSIARVITILGNVMLLTDFCSGSYPLALTFATRRKNLRSELTQMIDVFLRCHYGHLEGDPAQILLAQYIAKQTTKMKSETLANRKRRVVQGTLAKAAVGIDINIRDTTEAIDLEMFGTVVRNGEETTTWRQLNALQEMQLEQDLAHAKQAIDIMSRLPGYGQKIVETAEKLGDSPRCMPKADSEMADSEMADRDEISPLPEYSAS